MSENPIIIEHEVSSDQEPTKETLKTKATNFYRKHKKKVIAGGAVVGGIVTVSVLKSLTSDDDTEQEDSADHETESYTFTLDATEKEAEVIGGILEDVTDTSVDVEKASSQDEPQEIEE